MIEQSHHELRQAFRALLHGTGCKFAASVFDPISVRMASDLGFEVAIQGGSVASLQVLGAPDISLLTLDEYAECQEFQLGQQGTPWRVLACLVVFQAMLINATGSREAARAARKASTAATPSNAALNSNVA